MTEKEYKILIPENVLPLLDCYSPWDNELSQMNFYYDIPEQTLHKNGIVIRVRNICENLYLQIKIAKVRDNNVFISEEYEKRIEKIPYTISSSEIIQLFNVDFSIPDVYMHGFMQTNRKQKMLFKNTVLFLDENIYSGHTDYEIEIEYEETEKLNLVLTELSQLGINTIANGISKCKRFFLSINDSVTSSSL